MLFTQLMDGEIFSGGPPRNIELKLHLLSTRFELNIKRRAIAAVLISWPPLMILVMVNALADGKPVLSSFFTDAGCYARYLVAVPLLILAEGDTIPIFGNVVRHFLSGGFISSDERGPYNAAVQSTRRLLDSRLVEIAAVIIAYALAVAVIANVRREDTPAWYWNGSSTALGLSPAGMWHALISLPLLLLFCLGWLWKIILWWRFLWRMSKLDLRLVSTHPDQAGGMKFVSTSVRGYRILTLAVSTVVAGAQMNRIIHGGLDPLDVRQAAIAAAVFGLTLATAPLFLFVSQLRDTKLKGIYKYGALGRDVGKQFEKKWLDHLGTFDSSTLGTNDFSAMTDLNQIVGNAYNVRDIPFSWRDVSYLAIIAVMPFIPVALMAVPVSQLIQDLAKLLI